MIYDTIWHDMIYDMILYIIWYDIWYEWYDMIGYDMIWYDMIWYDMIWYDMIWYDMIWYDTIWYDMIWYDMIWYDMIWYDMICYDMIWYDMTCSKIAINCRKYFSFQIFSAGIRVWLNSCRAECNECREHSSWHSVFKQTKRVPPAASSRNCTAFCHHKYGNISVMKNLENTNL